VRERTGGAGGSSPDTVRILHASDLHVGDLHVDQGDPVKPLIEAALTEDVDVVVLVGDIFDHNRVPTEVGQELVDALARLPMPVVVLPGNHDCLVPDAIWRRVTLPSNVHVMTDDAGELVELEHLDVSIWGRPHPTYGDIRPLEGMPPRSGRTWDVALAHGHMVLRREDLHRAYQITPEEIAASDRDYIALGHWDVPHDMSAGDVTARYSGSASRFSVCALVTLTLVDGERRVRAERLDL
jgi:DNA repair exonuclease SbcCD nuclease subunit